MKLINSGKNLKTKIPFYLTFDLEDISHDLLYQINSNKSLLIREKSIFKSYEKLKEIIEKIYDNKKITIFTTGILAEKFPDMIKQISLDGHEIACHHFFHDKIYNKNQDDFAKDLDIAINAIENACGSAPVGYRAPFFSINQESIWAYEEISKRFKYDSSFRTSQALNSQKLNKTFKFENSSLYEFYIYEKKYLFNNIKIKAGGSFFRLFSKKIMKDVLEESYKADFIPIIYLHPYDILTKKEFWLKLSDFTNCKSKDKFLYWLKQNQWHCMGNKSINNKLEYLKDYFEHIGKMCDHKDIN